MVGGLFLSFGRPTRQQQKACIARSGGFNYDPKFHGASSPLRSSLGDEEEALSKSGFFVNRARVLLGAGPRTFDLAKSALVSWKHFGLGWTFVDPETPVEKGERFCVCVKEVIPWLMMPLQIAYVRDEISGRGPPKASFGFGSGTLQGHLLAGEERFSIERDENDEVCWLNRQKLLLRRKAVAASKEAKEEQRVMLLAAIAEGWLAVEVGEQKAVAAREQWRDLGAGESAIEEEKSSDDKEGL
ncbi:hypothetical protein OPV22_030501 [Ensete ventricosum]|uniref:DUF1990 domain-containing protein n=1 Tax=Ensete ventricosum TaxID=4639 RepID=A0AAV8QGC4_ENSVE|nr:hypothetical protein OPV22_030501 [Ensete ventricosum]